MGKPSNEVGLKTANTNKADNTDITDHFNPYINLSISPFWTIDHLRGLGLHWKLRGKLWPPKRRCFQPSLWTRCFHRMKVLGKNIIYERKTKKSQSRPKRNLTRHRIFVQVYCSFFHLYFCSYKCIMIYWYIIHKVYTSINVPICDNIYYLVTIYLYRRG